ncbi:MAG: hypothetical protein IPL62_01745 [Caulobacteraceae bacterium]|nr:hypothetical protein [Caulobacteraceae bacterium]
MREAFAVRLLRTDGTLQMDEVLQHVFVKGRELHDDAGRQIPWIDRKVHAPEARRTTNG